MKKIILHRSPRIFLRKWVHKASILLFFIMISKSYAAALPGQITFTVGEGYDHFAFSRHIDNTNLPFGAVAYNFTEHWGLEGLLGVFTTNSHLAVDAGEKVNGALFMVDVLYHFLPQYRIVPYVLAGPGLLGMRPNGTNADTAGIINAGGGLQWFLNQSIALRIEARDIYTIVSAQQDLFGAISLNFLINP